MFVGLAGSAAASGIGVVMYEWHVSVTSNTIVTYLHKLKFTLLRYNDPEHTDLYVVAGQVFCVCFSQCLCWQPWGGYFFQYTFPLVYVFS